MIIGGGGLFQQCEAWNRDINEILNKCKHVISWGCGINSHYNKNIQEQIDFKKFLLLSVRDYECDYVDYVEYVPCVSCLNEDLSKKYEEIRNIGIVEHKEYPICEFEYERIDNSCSIDTIINFIDSSRVIITNTYHVAY